jgi:transposase
MHIRCNRPSKGGRRWPETPQNCRMNNGTTSPPDSLSPQRPPGAARHRCPTGPVARASCGSGVPAPIGKLAPRDTRRSVRAGAACAMGRTRTSGARLGAPSWGTAIARAPWIGRQPWPMAGLPRPKQRGLRGQPPAGQRHAVDGGATAPAEVQRIAPPWETMAVPRSGRGRPRKRPTRLIYAQAGEAAPLRQRGARRGMDRSCPHRKNRQRPPLQEGPKGRRYQRRWKVARTFAWFGNFRRLVVRWERQITMDRAFLHGVCLLITLRKL